MSLTPVNYNRPESTQYGVAGVTVQQPERSSEAAIRRVCASLRRCDARPRARKKDSRLIDVSPYLVRAERVGFEPTVPCGTPVFETGTFGHSVTSPIAGWDDRSHPAAAPSLPAELNNHSCRPQMGAA